MIEDPDKIARRSVALLEEWGMLKKPAPSHQLKDRSSGSLLKWAGIK
jgi:hypothetical protein